MIELIYFSGLVLHLLKIAYIDYCKHEISDKDIILGLPIIFIWQFFQNNFINCFMGFIYNGSMMLLFYLLTKQIYKKEVYGQGDVTLNFMLGAIVGFNGCFFLLVYGNIILFIFMSFLYISKIKGRYDFIPLAPIYIFNTIFYLCFENLIHLYLYF